MYKRQMRYSETFDPSIYRQLGFYDSLENAVEYVSTHGKWESLYRNGCQPYLKMAYPITNSQNSGYHFVFGMKKDGVTIEYSEGDIISADVLDVYKRQQCGLPLVPWIGLL